MIPQTEDWVWLARIRHTQGRKGEVFAEVLTDFPEKFSERRQLWLLPSNSPDHPSAAPQVPRPVELVAHWLHKGGVVLHFAGVDSISAAEALAGLVVAIPRAQRAALPQDEVHIADLIGCDVFNVSAPAPVRVGVIENVDRTAGPVPLLLLQGAHGEILIPFAKDYLRTLDIPARRLDLALPEGLVDLNG
ncbi:16S rRNA processing protein RimM [Acidobacteria bacterium AB60]|nr:16S rRNA processing protein RimM [Acidobacteria bacterium AB60]